MLGGARTMRVCDRGSGPAGRKSGGVVVISNPPPRETQAPEESWLLRHLPRTFDALKFGPFRWYLGALIWWNAAMSMQMLIRGYLAYDVTGSFAALGTMALVNAVPMLVLSPLGGVIADRRSRRLVLQLGQIFSLLVALVMAVIVFAGLLEFWHLLVAAVAQGTMMALVMPSRQSLLPEIVGMRRLMNAIPLQTASMNLMQIIGPTIGGFLIDWIGAGYVYVVMTVMYMMSVLMLFAVRSLSPEEREAEAAGRPAGAPGRRGRTRGAGDGRPRQNPLVEMAGGARYLLHDRILLSVISFAFIGSVLGMPIRRLLPGYVAEVFGDSGSALGLMQMGMGVGALAGALGLATLRMDKHRGLLLASSALLMGTAMLAFALTEVFWFAWAGMLVMGIGSSGRQALSQMLVQDYVEEEYRGRVMSIFMMQISMMNVGTFIVSLYMDRVGPEFAIGSLGAALIMATLTYITLVPRFRQLR